MQGDDGEAKQNWFDTLMENLILEIEKIIDICTGKVLYPSPKGHGIHQKYSHQEATLQWKSEISTIKSVISKIRQEGDNNEGEQISAIMKVLKIKDNILSQTFAAMTYKKTWIWTDLKIMPGSSKNADTNDEIYTSEKIAEVHEKMDDLQSKLGYIPVKCNFQPLETEKETAEGQEKKEKHNIFTMAQSLEATIDSNLDMEEFIKAKFLFSAEKIQDCLSTNTVQKTLREKNEELNQRLIEVNDQYKDALGRVNERENGNNDNIASTQNQLRKAELDRDAK